MARSRSTSTPTPRTRPATSPTSPSPASASPTSRTSASMSTPTCAPSTPPTSAGCSRSPEIDADPAKVVELERKLAAGHWDVVKRRDAEKSYNLVTFRSMGLQVSGFNWIAWFGGLTEGIEPTSELFAELVVRQPSYVRTFAELWTSEPLEDWRAWLTWRLLHSRAPYPHLGDRRGELRLLRQAAHRCPREPRTLEARGVVGAGPARRSGRQAVRRATLPTGGEDPHGGTGRQPHRGLSAQHHRPGVDVAADPHRSAGEARQVHAEDRLPRQVARLLRR